MINLTPSGSTNSSRSAAVEYRRAIPGAPAFVEARVADTSNSSDILPDTESVVVGNEGLQVRLIKVPTGPPSAQWKMRFMCGPVKGILKLDTNVVGFEPPNRFQMFLQPTKLSKFDIIRH